MIYTVTLNPAIDYVMPIEALCPGQILRSAGEKLFFGGKGINVSLVLKALGVSSTATGFVAGFTGKARRRAVPRLFAMAWLMQRRLMRALRN